MQLDNKSRNDGKRQNRSFSHQGCLRLYGGNDWFPNRNHIQAIPLRKIYKSSFEHLHFTTGTLYYYVHLPIGMLENGLDGIETLQKQLWDKKIRF